MMNSAPVRYLLYILQLHWMFAKTSNTVYAVTHYWTVMLINTRQSAHHVQLDYLVYLKTCSMLNWSKLFELVERAILPFPEQMATVASSENSLKNTKLVRCLHSDTSCYLVYLKACSMLNWSKLFELVELAILPFPEQRATVASSENSLKNTKSVRYLNSDTTDTLFTE